MRLLRDLAQLDPVSPLPISEVQCNAFISTRSITPWKSASLPHGSCRTSRVGLEAVHHHPDGAAEVRARAVHLVHERDAGIAVAVGLAPDGLGLRPHACDRVEDR